MEGSDKVILYNNQKLPEIDAMFTEQKSFAEAIQNDQTPLVSGWDGLEALRIAELINQQLMDQK